MSSEGWAIFFHRPYGAFDLNGGEGRLIPDASGGASPLDAFLVVAHDPAQIMREYAAITGFPHLPPLWSLGYMQSRRTLESREEVLDEADEFRRQEACLATRSSTSAPASPPADGTSATEKFEFNQSIFPDPRR